MPAWLPRIGLEWVLQGTLTMCSGMGEVPRKITLTENQDIRPDIYNSTVKICMNPILSRRIMASGSTTGG